MNNYNYVTIKIETALDKADILGLLLEKYEEGSTYNPETKIWKVSQEKK